MDEHAIEREFQDRIASMSPRQKMSRCAAMFAWTRQQMARQIRKELPLLSEDAIRWKVALRLYERDPQVVELIKEHFPDVSG